MKFVHAADIHLDSPLRGLPRYDGAPVDELRQATRRAFERLAAFCLDEKVDFLLLAGDLYDGDWQDYNTGLFFAKHMSRLREAQIPVFLIRGNHDAESKITRQLKLPDNVHTFGAAAAETVRLEDCGIALHGRSFATQAMTENLSLSYPAPCAGFFNIGVLHTSADGRPGHESYAPCSLGDLVAKGYAYWALGHVHQREVLCAGEPWVVFPGNLQGRHVRETGEKGCTLVTVNEGQEVRLEHRTLDVVRWCCCDVDATGATSLDDVLIRARAALERLLPTGAQDGLFAVRVMVRGVCAAHRVLTVRMPEFTAELRALANDLGNIWIEQVKPETRAVRDAAAMQGGPLAHLTKFIHALGADDAGLEQLAGEFRDLKRKLPAELCKRVFPDEIATIREQLGEVEQLLIGRLLAADDAG